MHCSSERLENKTKQNRAEQSETGKKKETRVLEGEGEEEVGSAHTQAASSYNGPHRQECAVRKHSNANM